MPAAASARTHVDAPIATRPRHASGRRQRSRRAVVLTWLRKTHLYLGLWGALLGLLFGATGILMNHRAIMKIPVQKTVSSSVQLALPAQRPGSAQELADWLRQELRFQAGQVAQIRSAPEKTVFWNEREVIQPERWNVLLHSPRLGVNAEYFVGNGFVRVDRNDATFIGTLTRLHMAVGVDAAWVLLSDSIAGCLILLSLTGLLLWTQLHTVRTLATLTSVGALLVGLASVLPGLG